MIGAGELNIAQAGINKLTNRQKTNNRPNVLYSENLHTCILCPRTEDLICLVRSNYFSLFDVEEFYMYMNFTFHNADKKNYF
jgi:hypothetical protein